jgi:hypothetical protein
MDISRLATPVKGNLGPISWKWTYSRLMSPVKGTQAWSRNSQPVIFQEPSYRICAGKTRPGARNKLNVSETGIMDVSQIKRKTSHRQRSRANYLKKVQIPRLIIVTPSQGTLPSSTTSCKHPQVYRYLDCSLLLVTHKPHLTVSHPVKNTSNIIPRNREIWTYKSRENHLKLYHWESW